MIRVLLRVVLNGIALVLTATLVPGIEYSGGLLALLLAGAVIGLINVLVRPLAMLLTLPLIILTLGLFYFVVNGLLLWLAALLLPQLSIDGCFIAIVGGVVMGLINWAIGWIGQSIATARGPEGR